MRESIVGNAQIFDTCCSYFLLEFIIDMIVKIPGYPLLVISYVEELKFICQVYRKSDTYIEVH